MVGLIFESPLAEGNVAAVLLQMVNHVCEVFLFKLIELIEAFGRSDIDVVFSLGLGGFERTG